MVLYLNSEQLSADLCNGQKSRLLVGPRSQNPQCHIGLTPSRSGHMYLCRSMPIWDTAWWAGIFVLYFPHCVPQLLDWGVSVECWDVLSMTTFFPNKLPSGLCLSSSRGHGSLSSRTPPLWTILSRKTPPFAPYYQTARNISKCVISKDSKK